MMNAFTDAGLALITSYEGLGTRPFLDEEGIVRIGYGHALLQQKRPLAGPEGLRNAYLIIRQPMGEQSALQMLKSDLLGVHSAIKRTIHTPLTQRQYDALSAFIYCLYQEFGLPLSNAAAVLHARAWDMVRRLNAGDMDGAAECFDVSSRSMLRILRRSAVRHYYLQPDKDEPCAANSPPSTPCSTHPGCSHGSSCLSCAMHSHST